MKTCAMAHAMVLWDRLIEELTPEFPEVETEKVHIDALAMPFVRDPSRLDLVVA